MRSVATLDVTNTLVEHAPIAAWSSASVTCSQTRQALAVSTEASALVHAMIHLLIHTLAVVSHSTPEPPSKPSSVINLDPYVKKDSLAAIKKAYKGRACAGKNPIGLQVHMPAAVAKSKGVGW